MACAEYLRTIYFMLSCRLMVELNCHLLNLINTVRLYNRTDEKLCKVCHCLNSSLFPAEE